MAFPFPHYQKEKYERTFLAEVSFKLWYVAPLDVSKFKTIATLFSALFDIELNDIKFTKIINSKLKVVNKEGGVTFEFDKEYIRIDVDQDQYVDYLHSMKPWVEKIISLSEREGIEYRNFELKFIDLWPLAKKEEVSETSIERLVDAIFSKELRELEGKKDDAATFIELKDNEFEVVIIYDYYLPQEDSEKGLSAALSLDTKCKSNIKGLGKVQVVERVGKASDILYNAFRWSVTPLVIQLMKAAD